MMETRAISPHRVTLTKEIGKSHGEMVFSSREVLECVF
jgi:hypothetical protein